MKHKVSFHPKEILLPTLFAAIWGVFVLLYKSLY